MSAQTEQRLYLVFLFIVCLLIVWLTDRAYQAGPLWAVILALCISWLPMQILAEIQGYSMLNPAKQFWQFYFGDGFFLPATIALLAVLRQHSGANPWWESTAWLIVCVVLAATIAFVFRDMEWKVYRVTQMDSPTKEWHDFVAFFGLSFVLLRGVPALFGSSWNLISSHWAVGALALVAFLAWVRLLPADMNRNKDGNLQETAHPDFPRWQPQPPG